MKLSHSAKDASTLARPAPGTKVSLREMTCFAEKKVESRVCNNFRAQNLAEQGVTRPVAAEEWRESAITRCFVDYVLDSDALPNTMTFLPRI